MSITEERKDFIKYFNELPRFMQDKWISINPWLKSFTLSQQKPEHDQSLQNHFHGAMNQTATVEEPPLLCDGCQLPIEKSSNSMTICSFVDGNCFHFHLNGKIEDWCYHKYRPDLVKSQWEMAKKRYTSCSDGKHVYSKGEEFNPPYLVAILGQKRCEKCLH